MCSTGYSIYCPRGIVFVDSFIQSQSASMAEVISVHSNYPAGNSEGMYDSLYALGSFSNSHLKANAWPQIVVDRKVVSDPDSVFFYYDKYAAVAALADIALKPVYDPASRALDLTATVHCAANASRYNLAMVLTEDSVHGTTTDYDQRNAYANNANGNMIIGNLDFAAQDDPVPAELMYYRNVARTILPSFAGKSGSLPALAMADSTYSYTFPTYSIPAAYNASKMRVIVLLINSQNGQINNANGSSIPNSAVSAVHTVSSSAASVSIYPNPSSEKTSLVITLPREEHVSLGVTNMLGENIRTEDLGMLSAGEHTLPLSLKSLSAGVYFVKVKTDQGILIEKVFVN
jgi:hypothetical protein